MDYSGVKLVINVPCAIRFETSLYVHADDFVVKYFVQQLRSNVVSRVVPKMFQCQNQVSWWFQNFCASHS